MIKAVCDTFETAAVSIHYVQVVIVPEIANIWVAIVTEGARKHYPLAVTRIMRVVIAYPIVFGKLCDFAGIDLQREDAAAEFIAGRL